MARRERLDGLAAAALRTGGHRTLDAAAIVAQLAAMTRHFALRAGAAGAAAERDATALLARLCAAGLAVGADGRFDLAEAVNLLAVLDARGEAPSGAVETGRRLVARLAGAGDGATPPDSASLTARRFTVSFERTFGAAGGRRRMPLPIADARLRDLEVAIEGVARIGPGHIEASGGDRLGARFTFLSDPGAADTAADGDRALWLAEREGEIHVTPRVRALAERLAGGMADPLEAIGALRDHLIDAFGCGIVHRDAIGAQPATDWVLDHGWYDCRLGAALLAALCRAHGIPARLVGGFLLWDAPAEHHWLEAWVPERGWLPYDLMAWGLSAGGSDPRWRGIYAGAIDHRMKTQLLPRLFTGGGARGPVHRLVRPIADGAETRTVSALDGSLIHADVIRIVTA